MESMVTPRASKELLPQLLNNQLTSSLSRLSLYKGTNCDTSFDMIDQHSLRVKRRLIKPNMKSSGSISISKTHSQGKHVQELLNVSS